MRNQQYFLGKYVIVVSEASDLEYVVAVFDNVKEMARQVGRTQKSMASVITRLYQGKKDHVMYQGKRHNVEFMPVYMLNTDL
jgi:hypothetical protein